MATDLKHILRLDRRLVILKFLNETPGYALNAKVLTTAVASVSHLVTHDVIVADLAELEDLGLVKTELTDLPSGKLLCASITMTGAEVATGMRIHPGVNRPSPKV